MSKTRNSLTTFPLIDRLSSRDGSRRNNKALDSDFTIPIRIRANRQTFLHQIQSIKSSSCSEAEAPNRSVGRKVERRISKRGFPRLLVTPWSRSTIHFDLLICPVVAFRAIARRRRKFNACQGGERSSRKQKEEDEVSLGPINLISIHARIYGHFINHIVWSP